jgi:aspartyl protease family protein
VGATDAESAPGDEARKGGAMVRFLVIGVVAALCAIGAAQQLSGFSLDGAPHAAAVTSPAADDGAQTLASTSGDASIVKAPDGHFWADAQVNGGHPIHFLVDTGATAVALTAGDARSLGIDPASLDYRYTVMTAAGPARAASVKLGDISVDHAHVEDVQAFVIDQGLQTSLLGMTYLGRLSKFEATPDTLVLKS